MNPKLIEIGRQAKKAAAQLANMHTAQKRLVLLKAAEALEKHFDKLLIANALDLENAAKSNMPEAMQDRLRLTRERIGGIADGIRQVASLDDPIGEIIESFERDNGLYIEKRRVPIGVIGIIFEARPNVSADAFALTFMSGNAVILKGGSDAINSNMAITALIRQVLLDNGVSVGACNLIEDTDRAITQEFMRLNEYVDLLIPRGGAGLIKAVIQNATVPVIETGAGNCHIYVDESADFDMAIAIIINAKTQRVSVCNACESLVIHSALIKTFLPLLAKALNEKNVTIMADEGAISYMPGAVLADVSDFGAEYLDYKISIKTVCNIDEAIEHINRYSTAHSEVIITNNKENADKFFARIDSACVYLNASSRFTDGFEFGFGAEIGISTQKIHARGPMGLKELTGHKYVICGNGQIRG